MEAHRAPIRWLRWGAVATVLLATGLLALVAHARQAAAPTRSTVWWDGLPVAMEEPAQMLNGTLMVPVRLFEVVGARVTWDGATKTAVLQRGEASVRLTVGSLHAWVDERRVSLPEPPLLVEGRLMVPLRAAAEGLGLEVRWDARLGRAELVAPAPVPEQPIPSPPPRRRQAGSGRAAESARRAAAGHAAQGGPHHGREPRVHRAAAAAPSAAPQATPYVPSPLPSPPPMRPSLEDRMAMLLSVLPVPRAADEGRLAASTGRATPGGRRRGARGWRRNAAGPRCPGRHAVADGGLFGQDR
ncbi:copper amine oxidase N-terminal domain-containing protein [Geochorda subterranea]|uniref:Copper amine oxidase N-terminal domain-containing protein n=1 Tax=Geochorda subterranea TaxID=3109564 RepID=A0ABZ1BMV5_9FIRM|nr:copper amine oxidase N-terminal domain-containing protein [Limnochorda sp. LNt]WRP13890.1 copper amine oxidase N-terminal domain-containing protein [Limnochorda sp. LNt]